MGAYIERQKLGYAQSGNTFAWRQPDGSWFVFKGLRGSQGGERIAVVSFGTCAMMADICGVLDSARLKKPPLP